MNEQVMCVSKGRAITARPLLRMPLALAVSLTLAALLAPAAQAAVPPALTATNPASPGSSLTPRIRGNKDGVITSIVHAGASMETSALGVIRRGIEPEDTITLYTDHKCAGPVAATGDAEELEGAGISVTVPPDSETTFYATQTDPGGTSGCSNGILYQQVTTPPSPPVFSAVTPASPANDNLPHFSGSAAANSFVTLYEDPTCSGSAVATGPEAEFAAGGLQVQVPDNSTTNFHAVATLAGISSACSSSAISYQEVSPVEGPVGGGPSPTIPPNSSGPGKSSGKPQAPLLRTIPGPIANDVTPLLTGSAPGAAMVKIYSEADCKGAVLVRGSASQFAAGLPVQIVPNTTISFYGVSIGADGAASACSPTPAVYTDDSIVPRTRITAGPGIKTLKHTVIFRFTDTTNGPDTSFLCRLDHQRWHPCHAPLRLTKLGHKRHTFRVKAFDAAGNREKTGVKRSFQVIAAP